MGSRTVRDHLWFALGISGTLALGLLGPRATGQPALAHAAPASTAGVGVGPVAMVGGGSGLPATAQSGAPAPASSRPHISLSNLPLIFEANQGQAPSGVRFLAHGSGYSLLLTDADAILVMAAARHSAGSTALRFHLLGANPRPTVHGQARQTATASYFLTNHAVNWHTAIPTYAQVKYLHVYRGVDLVYYGTQGKLEYDFRLTPHANPALARLQIEGARAVHLDAAGNLVVDSTSGSLVEAAPVAYQMVGGVRHAVPSRYLLLGHNTVGFRLGHYDPRLALTIDPILVYSTLYGVNDGPSRIVLDSHNDMYIIGSTGAASAIFTTTTIHFTPTLVLSCPPPGCAGPFIMKLNNAGNQILYAAYFGTSGQATDLAIDRGGNAYVLGTTTQPDFPTTANAYQTKLIGATDVVLLRLNASATRVVYCTLLGASTNNADTTGDTVARSLSVDGRGQAVVVGYTQGYNFPVSKHALQKLLGYGKGSLGTQVDGFVTKFNAAGTGLVYSTYLGGSGSDYADHVALDSSGNAYVVGQTNSADFPVAPHALQAAYSGGDYDAYVTKLNTSGSGLIFSTFIGQTSADRINGMVLDGAGSIYLTGQTNGGIVRTIGVVQPSSGGGLDAFVMKLSARGVLEYSTYLGGQGDEIANGIAIDPIGNAYVTGSTTSATFNTPVFPLSHQLQGSLGGNRGGFGMQDAFIAKLNTCGSALLYSSYLGGTFADAGNAIAVDSHGNAYVAGTTYSPNFPLLRPLKLGSKYFPPAANMFVAKIADRQEGMAGSCPLPLIVNLSAPSVSSTGVLTVTVRTAPGASVKTSLVVVNTVPPPPPPTPVKGAKPVKGPKPPKLGAILYRKTIQGHADAYGLYVGGLHVNYKITAAVQATLSLNTFLGHRTASTTQSVQITP